MWLNNLIKYLIRFYFVTKYDCTLLNVHFKAAQKYLIGHTCEKLFVSF